MKTRRTIALIGLAGFILAGLVAPAVYATEDGQFPVFPTVIGDAMSPATTTTTTTPTERAPVVKIEKTVERESRYPTNEADVFSPWAYVTQGLFGRADARGEGVTLALEPVDAKPSSRGDLRYQIVYANNTDETLRNVSIQIFLPKNFQYLDSDIRPDSKNSSAVVFELGKVAAGESGVIGLEVRAKKSKVKDAFVSATMVYEDIDGVSHTVNATASNAFNGKNGGGLTASALDSVGGFMTWLFIIILIVALAFVVYQLVVLKASSQPRTQ